MMFMNGITHAKMYSRERSNVRMIAFLHSQFSSKLFNEMDERDTVYIVEIGHRVSPDKSKSVPRG